MRVLAAGRHTIMKTLLRVSCSWMIAFGFTAAVYAQYSSQTRVDTSHPGTASDQTLRGVATTAPAPTYPATSLARKITGVAVAAILIDRNGHLKSVTVLQAPDDAIGRSVHDALMRWTFRSSLGVPLTGKLFFYFRMKGRSGTVASPQEINPAIMQSQQRDAAVHEMTEAQLDGMRKTAKPNILDIRDRSAYQKGHRTGAVNIPWDEVPQRASIELPLHEPIVIDCYPGQPCPMMVKILAYLGFDKISVLRR